MNDPRTTAHPSDNILLNLVSRNRLRMTAGVALSIALIGVLIRLYFYAVNRSLWLDEAMLAVNIVDRTFFGLLGPLDLDQGAPLGFLLAQKTIITLFGSKDYILRLIPLAAGLVSVPLIYFASVKYVGRPAALISLGLFALSPKLIFYASELKQYATDVLITLALLFAALPCIEDKTGYRPLLLLAVTAGIAVWISHPSVFVFSGIFFVLGITYILRKESCRLYELIGCGVVWGVNLGIVYVVNLRKLASNTELTTYWADCFAPFPSWSNFSWYKNAFNGMLQNPAQLPEGIITAMVLIFGILSFGFRQWRHGLILTIPFGLTLIASYFGKYPFSGRLLLFLMPLLMLLAAEGMTFIHMAISRRSRPAAWICSAVLIGYFFYGPVLSACEILKSPPMGEDIKPAIAFLSEHRRDSDVIYLYYGAYPAFRFYAPSYGFKTGDYITGIKSRKDPDNYIEDLEKLKGNQRVWFLFSHNCGRCKVDEQEFILNHLDQIGSKEETFFASGVSVYRYDLAKEAVSNN